MVVNYRVITQNYQVIPLLPRFQPGVFGNRRIHGNFLRAVITVRAPQLPATSTTSHTGPDHGRQPSEDAPPPNFGGPPSHQRPRRAGSARRAPAEAERRRDRLPTHARGSALTSTSADVVRAPSLLPSLSLSSRRSRRGVSLAITPNNHKQQPLSVSASLRPAEQIPSPSGSTIANADWAVCGRERGGQGGVNSGRAVLKF